MNEVVWVAPSLLKPHPDRPKAGTTLSTEDGKYKLLDLSIIEEGIQDPIKVQRGTNIIIAGHTRWRIAMEHGLEQVPVRHFDVEDAEARYLMVVDNHKRIGDEKDPIKLAWTFKIVVAERGISHGGKRTAGFESETTTGGAPKQTLDQIAHFFDMKRSHFIRYLDLLRLIPELQQLVSQQKIGIKAGSILSKLSSHNQRKVFESIPPDSARKPDWRLTETEARNLANVYEPPRSSDESEESDGEHINTEHSGGLDDVFDMEEIDLVDIGQENTYTDSDENTETVTDRINELEQGGSRKYSAPDQLEITLAASQFVERPNRKRVLTVSKDIDVSYGEKGLSATKTVEDSAKKMARQLVLIEEVDKRSEFAKTQLSVAMDKQLNWIERVDAELVPLRVLVADEMDEKLIEKWNDLCEQVERVRAKLNAMA